ncbi:MAG: DNA-binding protein, AraC-type [bacterium]|nr:DNA-binding protein, AraC-type [bacterium]
MSPKLLQGRFFGRALNRRDVDDLVLVESRHAAGSRLPRHCHERAYFCLNHGGTYTEHYGRRRRVCRPGMLVFHPPGECHAEDHDSDVTSLNVELNSVWLRRIAECAGPLDRPAEFGGDDIAAAGLQILHELRQGDRDSALAIEGLAWEILAASAGHRARFADRRMPRWLSDARDLLDTYLGESISLRAVAAEAGVHPVHFAATFRRFFGCSVGEYHRRRRFQYARQQLTRPDVPLAQIAVDAGFADQSHLTRTFKRLTGMTPSRYRTFLGFKTHG